jgi:glycosyltransferase involved in cell wall biosynthesis
MTAPSMQPGLVSTIIPVYNRAVLLTNAVASVLAQTYRPIEIIVVDDGSTDDTATVADTLAEQHGEMVRVIHQANGGVGAAREAGRQAARGEFIQYLDSDDVLLPRKFELQVAGLRECQDCDVAYGRTRYRRADGSLVEDPEKSSAVLVEAMFPSFLQSRWWDTATPLYRRTVCDRAGPWTNLSHEEDWEYDCRVAALGGKLFYCDEDVAETRDHHDERLSRGAAHDRKRLAHRARAHAAILGHARRAGITRAAPEMRHFARELFLLSRQCGRAHLAAESRMLLELAEDSSERNADIRLYRRLSRVFGYTLLGTLACASDRLRI